MQAGRTKFAAGRSINVDAAHQFLKQTIASVSALTDEEWEVFADCWKPHVFKKGDYVIREGQIEHYLYFFVEGAARVFFIKDDEEYTAVFTYKGFFGGDVTSFLTRRPAIYYQQAVSDCKVLRITYQDRQRMLDQYKGVERWARLMVEQLAIGMQTREVSILSYSAEERFHRLIDQSPHIFQLYNLKHIASYLGMSPETLSRLRKKFAQN